MIKFDYKRANTVEECLKYLDEFGGKAKLLAGGTDLLVDFRANAEKVSHVEAVIDTVHIPDLRFIREDGDRIILGAGVTFTEIAESTLLRKYAPFLCDAAFSVGSPQIRNAGTIAGSLGTASPASDPAPPLVAMDGSVLLVSSGGSREVSVEEFLAKPYRPGIEKNEMIKSVSFKKLNPNGGFSFVKLGRRKTLAIARMNVAVYIEKDEEGSITDARIVPGASFPSAVRVSPAEEMLLGRKPSPELFIAAGNKVSEEMISVTGRRWSTPYKEPVIAVLVKRALDEASGVN